MNGSFNQSVQFIKGVGPESAEKLRELGIFTVRDLLYHFPFRYEDRRVQAITQAAHDENITISGQVQTLPTVSFYGRKKSRLSFKCLTGQHLITVVAFNQSFLKGKLTLGMPVTITGRWNRNRLTITATSIRFSAESSASVGGFEPVYHLREGIGTQRLHRWIENAYTTMKGNFPETLPTVLLEKYRLCSLADGLRYVHFPKSEEDLKQAKRRFAYEEFLHFQLKMQMLRKSNRENAGGNEQCFDEVKLQSFIASLSFQLTSAQQRVIHEITNDMRSKIRMNRLLQGDVGSGKTVVAATAALASVNAGYQVALMAPTEILAEQHLKELTHLFTGMNLRLALLTASIRTKARKELLIQLADGKIDVLIGTHALLQKDVDFAKLGLVITDEQHRFGVEQRRILREKGIHPDVLFMTATPIPRTLAIAVFGEMDVSTIDEMPIGRKEVITAVRNPAEMNKVIQFLLSELNAGRQAYVICPLIEESEKMDFQNAVAVHAQLSTAFHNHRVGLLHGRLSQEEKEEMMAAFAKNSVQVLVSTTVVEVGVNVPNASCMVIMDAERFGLSQLHQLRGRVGRGLEQSYCILVANPKNETGVERLNIMTETNDGFKVSERDLALRGPGDFFGRKQSGIPEFKIGDMAHDIAILEAARRDAGEMIHNPAFWQEKDFQSLRQTLTESGILDGEKLD